LETTDKSGKIKMTMELEINEAAMSLIRENIDNMVSVASQWRPNMQGGKGKMGEGHQGMGMMHHGQQ
jgi:hypothetical protein